MRNYENFDQIKYDLKILRLERDISLEELKLVKSNFEESLKPLSIFKSIATLGAKYGLFVFIKKIFK